jgi:hypothetical protein
MTPVYNNYPWPEAVSEKQRAAVAAAAQKVLAVREKFMVWGAHAPSRASDRAPRSEQRAPTRVEASAVTCRAVDAASTAAPEAGALPKTATLADLYDPLAMPPALQQAHEELDRAVDKCYRPEPFTSERQRVEFLFALYEKLTAPLVAAAQPKRICKTKE